MSNEKPKAWLDCPECGEDAIPSNEEGLFHEDMHAVCPGCQTKLRVVVDEGFDSDEGHNGCIAYAREVDDE
jgi:uncharacterized paraquat-inducible protein A